MGFLGDSIEPEEEKILGTPRCHKDLIEEALFERSYLTILHRLFAKGSDRAAERWREDYLIPGRPFDIKLVAPSLESRLQDLRDTSLPPEPPEDQLRSDASQSDRFGFSRVPNTS
jgi:hypothetical protein